MSTRQSKLPARLVLKTAAASADSSRRFTPVINTTPALPAVNWAAVGKTAPALLNTPAGELPAADAVLIAWTEAEWAAMQHGFCNSGVSMPYSSGSQGSWTGWQKYTKNLPAVKEFSAWAEYRLVQVGSYKTLLFKSETHLDFPGKAYLTQLLGSIISNVKPKLIISTGTAGGARPTDHIGTVNVVDAAAMYESKQPPASWSKYSSPWKPNWSLISNPGFKNLLFPVPTTSADLQSICKQFNQFWGLNETLAVLNPGNVNMADAQPAINNLTTAGVPLLTASSFVVGTSSGNLGNFACVEMDDAVIAEACVAANIAYGSVRNLSDPVQNATLQSHVQAHWGQAIYDAYGLYTSYNGAIAAWAILDA